MSLFTVREDMIPFTTTPSFGDEAFEFRVVGF